ncbi:MAG: hypothetical protein FWD72_01590, partial [Eggerthellaceae bacterium]|nr:hypothetical protein [Eggerthellaceae bacterium]
SYYPSKDALVIELVRQATTMSSKSISSISEGDAPAAEVVKTISRMMCQMFAEAPMGIDYFMFMLQVGMSGFDVPQASGYSAQTPNPIETLAEIITRGQAEGSVVAGDPSQLSGLYWATIQGLCCCIIAGAPVTPEPRALSRILLKEEFL